MGLLNSDVISKPMYCTTWGELNCERKLCSFCNKLERESSADLTAKRSPEVEEARETVAELPRPMVGPLLHSIFGREQGRSEKVWRRMWSLVSWF